MLANLYRKAGQERSAVTSYKEVLRQCPLALDAIIGTSHLLGTVSLTSLWSKVVVLLLVLCCLVSWSGHHVLVTWALHLAPQLSAQTQWMDLVILVCNWPSGWFWLSSSVTDPVDGSGYPRVLNCNCLDGSGYPRVFNWPSGWFWLSSSV